MSPVTKPLGRIAQLNDQFRERACQGLMPLVPGMIVLTHGITSHGSEIVEDILRAVATFDAFSKGNDPNEEHDFGALLIDDVGRIFWKIDYCADANCDAGSEDPADPAKSFRVLTIMLAEEY
jgi:hypothetical protein